MLGRGLFLPHNGVSVTAEDGEGRDIIGNCRLPAFRGVPTTTLSAWMSETSQNLAGFIATEISEICAMLLVGFVVNTRN